MKNIFLLTILIFCFAIIHAQNKTDTTRQPAITSIAQPFGDIVTAKMDSKGGKLKSADGGLEIIFPADALDTAITVSIQSTHNEINDDDKGAYQLEPSGMHFKKPVQLIFHYGKEDEADDLRNIGTQNENGGWSQLKKVTRDTIEKTVSGYASHFSTWAVIRRFVLKPRKKVVETGGIVTLYVVQYPPPSDDDIELTDVKINGASVNNSDDGLVQLTETKINGVVQDQDDDLLAAPIKLNKFSVQNWSVNDMVGGDSHIGTVNGNKVAYYKAPASVPSPNPVTVKATIRVWIEEKIKTFSLTSKIKIIPDKFHFTYIHIDEN